MDKISTIKERILQYLEFKGITKEDFYKKTMISASNFKGPGLKSEIGGDKMVKILSIYDDINTEWLILGKGNILKTKNKEIATNLNGGENGGENSSKPNVKKMPPFKMDIVSEPKSIYDIHRKENFQQKGIPLIPIDAMAGFGEGSTQVMNYDTQMYVVPEFTELNVDFMIRVKGSSMYPKYNSGDLVACKKLFKNDIFFQWNKVYVLDTIQGALVKRVKKGIDKEHLLLISDNQTYDPIDLPWSDVFSIALVVGVIRLE